MKTKFSTAAAIFGTIALTTACTTPMPTSDQDSILGDGKYSTRTINGRSRHH